jgi:hypothetical protein
LYRPALHLRLHPRLLSISLLRLRCQGSALPTREFLSLTTRRHLPYQLRHCAHCPPNTLESHSWQKDNVKECGR